MRRPVIALALLGFAAACGDHATAPIPFSLNAQRAIADRTDNVGIGYVPINPNVFVSRKTVAGWVKVHNEAAVAAHAVALWNGLTAPSHEAFHGVPLAVYDTWYTPCQIYPIPSRSSQTTCTSQIINAPTFLDLELPEQLFHSPSVTGSDILSSVRYNQEMKNFVDIGYRGSPYTTGAGLVKAIDDGKTDLADTTAPSAMMVKPTYDLFSSTQPTVIGYWKGPGLRVPLGASTSPLVPAATTWLDIAVIDPTGKATNTVARTFCANTMDPTGAIVSSHTYTAAAGTYRVIPLSQFYAIPVTPREISNIRVARIAFSRQHRAGAKACPTVIPPNPVAALVGMHVVSAEQLNTWTWQTFWWNPTVKPVPGARPGFQHFDYATAYWTVNKPPYGWRYAFNPYLEANFGAATFGRTYWPAQGTPGSVVNLGITTNCISCHSQALYSISKKVAAQNIYVAHDSEPQLSLPRSIFTRNLWSLANRAGHP